MKRALPVVALSIAGLIPLWRYAPSQDTPTTTEAAEPAPNSPSTPSSSSPSSSSSSSSGAASRVVRGSTVTTAKGVVQVEVTFEGDTIGSVRMLQQPDHPQTTAAVPKLIEETLQAQSADIDTVSGATITSDGYVTSLQAALDAKGS
ncbi:MULTISPECIES: FMN-binding protein [unclassified Streptomyces]|uniref:FMN-binding protein n=1 Tax=unclassified Streptomyces TaxID=2593676 RepID=UPI002251F4B8|nr:MULTISPECIES: FMN-binding protein [unclassified Streptomyces]MCX4987681.1 FMN-binding protein [Streptomyces sp. NBC_00568]MCX5007187.1 FMN-binding protein [Streptomyces sp. NBC_00638]